MKWLERAAREISEKADTPTIKTIETPVSEVLKAPHPGISEKSAGAPTAPNLPPETCATCASFRATPGKTPDGHCTRYKVETWGAYANGCADGWTLAGPAARELERRRAEVVARLETDSTLRYAFRVEDGVTRFADNSRRQPAVFYRAALLVRQIAKGTCGLAR